MYALFHKKIVYLLSVSVCAISIHLITFSAQKTSFHCVALHSSLFFYIYFTTSSPPHHLTTLVAFNIFITTCLPAFSHQISYNHCICNFFLLLLLILSLVCRFLKNVCIKLSINLILKKANISVGSLKLFGRHISLNVYV